MHYLESEKLLMCIMYKNSSKTKSSRTQAQDVQLLVPGMSILA